MAILTTGNDFSDGDDVTSTKLDNAVNNAAFVSGASGSTDDSSLEVNGSGRLQVKDSGITSGKIAASAVTTSKLATSTGTSDGVTFEKLRQLESMKAIGNVTGSTAAPTQVSILDEDDMSSDSNTSLATQQSIKAYVDGGEAFGGTYTGGESVTLPNGMIMKMGQIAQVGDTGTPNPVTFASAFPTAVVSVIATQIDGASSTSDSCNVGSVSTTGFNIYGRQTHDGFYWQAIGY